MISKLLFYADKYLATMSMSLAFFLCAAFIGLFLIIRRESLAGMALTQASHLSFMSSLLLAGKFFPALVGHLETGHATDSAAAVLALDILTILLTVLAAFLTAALMRNLRNREAALAIAVVLTMSAAPVVKSLSTAGDVLFNKLYFSEILYAAREEFPRYLPVLSGILAALFIGYRRIFLVSFDPVLAGLQGISTRFWNILFTALAAVTVAITVHILGPVLTVAALLTPGFAALSLGRSMRSVLILTGAFAVFFPLTGFFTAFVFDGLPADPVLVITMALLCIPAHLSGRRG